MVNLYSVAKEKSQSDNTIKAVYATRLSAHMAGDRKWLIIKMTIPLLVLRAKNARKASKKIHAKC